MILGAGLYQMPLITKAKEMGLYTIVTEALGPYPGLAFADKICPVNFTNLENTLETAVKLTDKRKMKELFLAANVRTPAFKTVYLHDIPADSGARENFFMQLIEDLTQPCIFKAVDNSGSRGIIKVNSKDDFSNAYKEVLSNTKAPYFLIEEFITGEQIGVEEFIHEGVIVFYMPNGKYTSIL